MAECPPYDATGQYAFSTYDLMVQTALAVEAAGSYKASEWAPAMFEVGEGGEVCYTYADCIKLIREGKDIDYEGVTGPGLYSDGGVNAVTPAYIPFKADGTTGRRRAPRCREGARDPRADQDRGEVRPGEPAQRVQVVAA